MGGGGDDTQESYARLVLLHHGHEWAVDPRHLRGDLQRGVVRGATGGAFGFDNQSLIAALQSGAQTAGSPSAPPLRRPPTAWEAGVRPSAARHPWRRCRARPSRTPPPSHAHAAPVSLTTHPRPERFRRSARCASVRTRAVGPSSARSTRQPARSRYPATTSETVGSSSPQDPRGPAPGLCPQRLVRLLHASSLASRRAAPCPSSGPNVRVS